MKSKYLVWFIGGWFFIGFLNVCLFILNKEAFGVFVKEWLGVYMKLVEGVEVLFDGLRVMLEE